MARKRLRLARLAIADLMKKTIRWLTCLLERQAEDDEDDVTSELTGVIRKLAGFLGGMWALYRFKWTVLGSNGSRMRHALNSRTATMTSKDRAAVT